MSIIFDDHDKLNFFSHDIFFFCFCFSNTNRGQYPTLHSYEYRCKHKITELWKRRMSSMSKRLQYFNSHIREYLMMEIMPHTTVHLLCVPLVKANQQIMLQVTSNNKILLKYLAKTF